MFGALVKTRISGMLSQMMRGSKNGKKRGAGFKILIGLLVIYVIGCFFMLFGMMFYTLCEAFVESGLTWLYFSMAAIMSTVLAFVGSIFMTQSQLYDARDNELLLSMPIKPQSILASRMVVLYITGFALEALVMLPAGIVYLIQKPAAAASIAIYVALLFVLPLIALALSCIVGFVVAFISSKMRNKTIITMVLSIGFFIAYFLLIGRMNNYLAMIIVNGGELAEKIKSSLYIVYSFGMAIAEADMLSFVLFTAIAVAAFLLIYFVLSLTFIKIATTKRGATKVKYREKELKVSSIKSSLVKKELVRFFKNPMYIMNGCIGSIFLLIAAVALCVKSDILVMISEMLPGFDEMLALIGMALICAINTMNLISAPSISLDAKTLWISQSIPVDPGDILDAKAKTHLVVTTPTTIMASIAVIICTRAGISQAILTLLLPCIVNFFFAYSGVFINLHLPKFDWTSEMVAIKQSGSIVVAMLVNFGVVAAVGLLYFLLLQNVIGMEPYLYIVTVVLAALSYLIYRYFYKKGGKIYMSF